ncbi:glycosyltransferase family 4 protein [Methanothermobacter thermautotrophicus]|nr:glycosyltransferase family 4 protein [Methanothermobacter thermautotrophicus]
MEAEHLVKRGHEVFVITTSPNEHYREEYMNGVKIYRLPPNNLYAFYDNFKNQNNHKIPSKVMWHIIDTFNLRLKNKIRTILLDEKPDLVHVHNFGGLSTLLFNEIKNNGLPVVFTAHDYSVICPKANLLRSDNSICEEGSLICLGYAKIKKFLLGGAVDVVISPSQFLINKLRENNIFNETEMIKLPNPIELGETSPSSKPYHKKLMLLYVGELSKHKGLHILIEALKRIDDENICVDIYGRGVHEDYFKSISKDLNVFFRGYANGFEELKKAYQNANVTVVPSICYEVFGMIILESFMNSTPVIASRIGGIPEVVRDGYNGFLFKPGSVNGLRRILERISEHPSILKELERNAYKSSQGYSIEDHVKKLEEIYRGLL